MAVEVVNFIQGLGVSDEAKEKMNQLWNDGYEQMFVFPQQAMGTTYITLIFHKMTQEEIEQKQHAYDEWLEEDEDDFVPPPDDVNQIPF